MEEKILELIYNYSKNNKLADRDFIIKVVSIVTEYKKLEKYVKKVEYGLCNKYDNASILAYNFKEKSILVYNEKLNEYLNKFKSNDVFVPEKDKLFYKNVEVVEGLLHELEHADQSKTMENDNTQEAEILKLTGVGKSRELFSIQLRKNGFNNVFIENILNNKLKNYYKYYEFAPHERLAEINAHQTMAEILYPLKNFVPNIYKLENIFVLKNKLKGYTLDKKLISPTIYYLKNQSEEASLNKFPWYDKNEEKCLVLSKNLYNTEKRINLGLPIDKFEYKSLNKELERFTRSL